MTGLGWVNFPNPIHTHLSSTQPHPSLKLPLKPQKGLKRAKKANSKLDSEWAEVCKVHRANPYSSKFNSTSLILKIANKSLKRAKGALKGQIKNLKITG